MTLDRTTQQIVIRFPAYPNYEVMSPETITLTLPGSSVKSGNRIFVAPAFRIRASSGAATLAGRVLQRLTEEVRFDRIRTRPEWLRQLRQLRQRSLRLSTGPGLVLLLRAAGGRVSCSQDVRRASQGELTFEIHLANDTFAQNESPLGYSCGGP